MATLNKDMIKQWYDDKKWNATMVRAAVVSGTISQADADEIINGTTKKKATTRKKKS